MDEDIINFYHQNPAAFVEDMLNAKPNPDQLMVLKSLPKNKRLTVRSGNGRGKCLGIDTPILMFDGSIKKVQDVVVGDKLMGDDSTPRNVLSTTTGIEQMYRIKYRDGTFYDVNESHILSLKSSGKKNGRNVGDVKNISVRDYLKWDITKKKTHTGYKVGIDFKKQSVKIDPYILGSWLGDGLSSKTAICGIDEEILNEWRKEAINRNLKFRKCYKYVYSILDDKKGHPVNSLLNDLRSYNLIKNKHIPEVYKINSKETRLKILAGLIDTDGYVDKNCSMISISQKNKQLAYDILFLARSVGCHATIKKVSKFCMYKGLKKYGIYYNINITRNIEQIPMKVLRKKIKITKRQRNNLHFGITVEKLKIDNYYGFEIDGNRLFVLGDFTVTHNTALESWIVLWFLTVFPDSRVICTAVKQDQLFDVLWAEIDKWLNKSILKDQFVWTATSIYNKDCPNTWYAIARVAKEKTAFQGFHEENILFLVDEASGVDDDIWEAIMGGLTTKNAYAMLFGNPNYLTGFFYDSFHKNSVLWKCFHLNSPDNWMISQSFIQEIINTYGEDSNEYRIRVLGEFPIEDASDLYLPLSLVKKSCVEKVKIWEESPNADYEYDLGVDIARYGDDDTVFTFSRHDIRYTTYKTIKITRIESVKHKALTEVAGKIIGLHLAWKFKNIFVDETGLGAGVYDILKEKGLPVVPVTFNKKLGVSKIDDTNKEAMYKSLKLLMERQAKLVADKALGLRTQEANIFEIPEHNQLITQCATLHYKYSSNGVLMIHHEDGGHDDYSDSLALSLFRYVKSGKRGGYFIS